jgi:hypothetical protein
MRVVVTGMIATLPYGGVAWDYGQYALGFARLGCDVFYLEDVGYPPYDPRTGDLAADHGFGAAYLEGFLGPALGDRWHVRGLDGRSYGMAAGEIAEAVAGADVLVNVSACAQMRDEYLACPRKVLIDTDPGYNHFQKFLEPPGAGHGWRAHDVFLTYATGLGDAGCRLPDLGVAWRPTLPPVLPDLWEAEGAGEAWTTVMSWANYLEPVRDGDTEYGGKELEFARIEHLPGLVPELDLEVAAGGAAPPLARWRELGWRTADGPAVSATPEDYRRYVQRSRGELSVAKNVYVATRSGWFSCRSACYLAAGLPVVVQDTGFSRALPTGEGLLAFDDAAGAAEALRRVEGDYERHAAAARELAAERLAPEVVLAEILDHAMVS